ncbi:L-type lectin-domain containing receptor kinase IX.1-like [Rosa sericea]
MTQKFSHKQLQRFVFILLISSATSLTFDFPSFIGNDTNTVFLEGDAYIRNQSINLCIINTTGSSIGRASYGEPFLLRENSTGKLADFTTNFTFNIELPNKTRYADGMVFFLAPNGSKLNRKQGGGGSLGLPFDDPITAASENAFAFVAVEFDIHYNPEYSIEDPAYPHVGIDVNTLKSNVTARWNGSLPDGRNNSAWISYSSSTKNLSVAFTNYVNGTQEINYLSYTLDLNQYLPESVIVGFSAATGTRIALPKIHSWSFSSSLVLPPPRVSTNPKSGKNKIGQVVGLSVGGGAILVSGLGLIWLFMCKKRGGGEGSDEDLVLRDFIDEEFERGTGPRKFSYNELAQATNNFEEGGKLAEGGFGGVYRGFIKDINSYVAVKKISSGSKQGLKEYAAEVKSISRLRHRNLVQLIGWCHEKKLLLVYELMPNGSLDSHLFKEKSLLRWDVRYKITQGLASGLLYLHDEWEQCVLHRDIKSSNVMLDSNFNAKLGDFGLARLVDHGQQSQTTIVAGTRGYMALEYVVSGKASKQSDVYSFGIVALEIACGRKPIDLSLESNHVDMVEWVWELYGEGEVIEAADPKLCGDFDEKQMECLMIVGLWCAHPDYNFRPSIQQAIQVLNFEVPLPSLPLSMPVSTFLAHPVPPMFSSADNTCSEMGQNESSGNTNTMNSSTGTVSSTSNSHTSASLS